MIDINKILDIAKENLINYNARVARSPYASKSLTGESKVLLETILTAVNVELEVLRTEIKTNVTTKEEGNNEKAE